VTVYVETNFILEVALRQEEHEACEHLMTAAEAASARLVIPAFSLVEGWNTLRRRREERQRLLPALRTQADTLSRSAGASNVFAHLLTEWSLLEPALRQSEEDGMRDACARVVACAEVVDMTSADVSRALELAERLGLRIEDAVVLAAVLQHASSGTSGSACS
jgi:predicted nucleic acid-binding protein